MLSGWWGRILLVLLAGLYVFGMISAYRGTFLPPLTKDKKFIRQDSRHYTGARHRGFFYGGSFGSGK